MRTLTLNQILIKNVDKWDNAKSKDFVKKKEDNQGSDINLIQETQQDDKERNMTINEEVKTTEYAPAIFKAIREMDNITDEMI